MTDIKSRNHYFKFRAHTADDNQSRVKDNQIARDFYHRFSNNGTSQCDRPKLSGNTQTFNKYKIGVTQQSDINISDDMQNGCLPLIDKSFTQNNRKLVISKNGGVFLDTNN